MISLRRFNHASIEAFEDTLARIGADEEIDVAALSLAEPTHTDPLPRAQHGSTYSLPRTHQDIAKLGARARWIPAVDDYSRYYRHLLAGPTGSTCTPG